MALHFDLRVNGEQIGTFEADRILVPIQPERAEYAVTIRQIREHDVVGWHGYVKHRPSTGAWALIGAGIDAMLADEARGRERS